MKRIWRRFGVLVAAVVAVAAPVVWSKPGIVEAHTCVVLGPSPTVTLHGANCPTEATQEPDDHRCFSFTSNVTIYVCVDQVP